MSMSKPEKTDAQRRDKSSFIGAVQNRIEDPDFVDVEREQLGGHGGNSINDRPLSEHTPELPNPRIRILNEQPKRTDEPHKQ